MSRIFEALAGASAELLSPYQTPPRSPLLMPEDIPPEVCVMFEAYALQAIGSGVTRYSADAILHRIRWFHHVERGNRDFKANNDWSSALARWFLAKHPDCVGFFELRRLRKEA